MGNLAAAISYAARCPGRTLPPVTPTQRRALAIGIIAYTVWGLLTVYWKQLERFDAYELITWRVCASAATMAVILTARRHWRAWRHAVAAQRRYVLLAACAVIVNWTSYVVAVVQGHVLETALGYFISPVTTIAVGVVVLGEQLTRARRHAVALGALAIVVLSIAVGRIPWLALLIAASWTAYGFLKRQISLDPLQGLAAEVFVLVPPALIVGVALAVRPTSLARTASVGELVLTAASGIATVIPLAMFAHAAQRLPMSVLAPTQYIVPTINFLLGWLAYHEALNGTQVVGFALIWVALALVATEQFRPGPRREIQRRGVQ